MHADNQPLTIEEQILLSASIDAQDGELTQAEHAQVQALLQRPQARAYIDSLRATRVLVGRHGAAKAPVGLKGRVLAALDEDFDDISRPTASRDGKVIALPSANWRTPVLALAAAVVVTLGVFFGPALIPSDKPASPADIARERLNNAPKAPEGANGDGHWGADKAPTDANKSGGEEGESSKNALRLAQDRAAESVKDAADEANEDSQANDPANESANKEKARVEEYRRARNGNAKPDPAEELGKSGRSEQPGTSDAPKDAMKKEASKGKKELSDHDTEGAEGKEPSKTSESGVGGGGKGGSTGGTGGQPQDRPGLDRKVGSKLEDAKNGPKGENRDDDGAPQGQPAETRDATPPAAAPIKPASPQQDAGRHEGQGTAEDNEHKAQERAREALDEAAKQAGKGDSSRRLSAGEVELSLQPGSVLSAQTDVLRIAALYGEARVLDEVGADQRAESVVVELDETKVAELVAALQRMAQRQEYGELKVPAALKAQAEPATDLAKVGDTMRDSLPSEVKVRLSGETPSPPAESGTATPPAPNTAPNRVRLTINLK